jgi:hypothetical protein
MADGDVPVECIDDVACALVGYLAVSEVEILQVELPQHECTKSATRI